ncbi:MAG: hypothetical protein FWF44_09280 [Defluviitaleaceae bacterium]|nr:hypothetical protein [Defluviitaleaceae bacterium]
MEKLDRTRFKPDFNELLKVLRKEKPSRPVLFELFMNEPVYELMTGEKSGGTPLGYCKMAADAFAAGGYDYVSVNVPNFGFPAKERHSLNSISLNDGSVITDWESYEKYDWMDPDNGGYDMLDKLGGYMPEGMKIMVCGPSGVLENTTGLMGYDNLCIAIYEEPELVKTVFDQVGSRILRYYENALQHDSVGLIMDNDDWGFKTQTFLSVEHMREYVFPWHKKIVEAAHRAGRPVVLHSCGYAGEIFEDIIEDMKFDGKHSYEDGIMPVERCYDRWGGRVAIMGGMDLDFLIRADVADIKKRCRAMLDKAEEKGAYALGTGNSVPGFVPYEKYLAMLECAWERR